jgi:hypothetical protein
VAVCLTVWWLSSSCVLVAAGGSAAAAPANRSNSGQSYGLAVAEMVNLYRHDDHPAPATRNSRRTITSGVGSTTTTAAN